jgi:hypothetical protein
VVVIARAAWIWHERGLSTFVVVLLAAGGVGLASLWSGSTLIKKRQQLAAQKILAEQKAVYSSTPHEYKEADSADFPDQDHDFYDRTQQWFESLGFRFIGDCEIVSLTRIYPHMRTFIRRMFSPDGTISVAIYHVKATLHRLPHDFRSIDLETELSNGTFLTTSNTLEGARVPPVPGIDAVRLPMTTPLDELLENHVERLAQALAATPGIVETRVQTMEDGYRFQRRMQEVKARHKKSVGYVGAEDIKAVRGRELTSYEQGVVKELEKLKKAGN